ncbi:alpha/beta-hydrolase [Dendrothele bispora CBS 962.96]|uniref:Alpha/beta-hydrolase n=1 Tax=Dendrothele bispora (strain CBS 962.96) TaxID=1314807 RepID=A0A4S8L5C4_DENBC|nr:alpha/beta-hydrolase [Dendrothele bispora CBS 962.96]
MRLFLFIPLVALFSWWLSCYVVAKFDFLWKADLKEEHRNTEQIFSWKKISASNELIWHTCYHDFQCARLSVPLNYSEPANKSAAIALIRVPATVGLNSSAYRGPVLFNLGGPGGSGVNLILRKGKDFATILGPQFDIVGFDPRGIARSTPRISFFDSSTERELWDYRTLQEHSQTSGPTTIAEKLSRSQLRNILAEERAGDILPFMNTDNTARDMLTITEAHGFSKLKYWGFSYGSILGSTFAAMFPDKVERLVIDGVADAEDYYETGWRTSLRDTSKTLQVFFNTCFSAGPSKCAFYDDNGPSAIEANLFGLYAVVKKKPFPVRTTRSYGLVDYNRLRVTIFTSLYSPYDSWPTLAEGLADLAKGNATKLFSMQERDPFKCPCSGEEQDDIATEVEDANTSILCNDGKEIPGTLEDAVEYHEKALREVSEWHSIWTGIRVSCSGWPDLQGVHFQGPVTGKTSFPLLVIGNEAGKSFTDFHIHIGISDILHFYQDPVTPLSS